MPSAPLKPEYYEDSLKEFADAAAEAKVVSEAAQFAEDWNF